MAPGTQAISITPSSFFLLNSNKVDVKKKVKLAKYLWVSNFVNLPHKEQSLLGWLTTSINELKCNSGSDARCLWSTLAEVLSSKQLDTCIKDGSSNLVIGPSFTKTFVRALEQQDNIEILFDLLVVGMCLLRLKLFNVETSKLELFFDYISALVSIHNRLHDNKEHSDVRKKVSMLLQDVLKQLLNQLSKGTVVEKGMMYFMKTTLLRLMKLCDIINDYDSQELIILINDVIKSFLGSRKMTSMQKKGKKNEKAGKKPCYNIILQALVQCKNPKWLLHIYNLYLEANSKSSSSVKFQFFTEFKSMLCEDLTTLEQMQTLSVLLKINHTNGLHLSFEDNEVQHQYYGRLLDDLVGSKVNFSEHWCSCIVTLMKINQAAVLPRAKEILLKLFRCIVLKDQDVSSCASWVCQVFQTITTIYVEIRKPLELLEIFASVIDEASSDCCNANNLLTMAKYFSSTFATECVWKSSDLNVVIMWEFIETRMVLASNNIVEGEDKSSNVVHGGGKKKKHTSDDAGVKSKIIKTTNGNTDKYYDNDQSLLSINCFASMLSDTLKNINFVNINVQTSLNKKIAEMFKIQQELIEKLLRLLSRNQSRLLVHVTVKLCSLYEQCYTMLMHYSLSALLQLKNPAEYWKVVKLNLQSCPDEWYETHYLWMEWTCYQITRLAWCIEHTTIESELHEHMTSMNESTSILLKVVEDLKTYQLPQCDQENICVVRSKVDLQLSTLQLLKTHRHVIIKHSNADVVKKIGGILFNSFPQVKSPDDDIPNDKLKQLNNLQINENRDLQVMVVACVVQDVKEHFQNTVPLKEYVEVLTYVEDYLNGKDCDKDVVSTSLSHLLKTHSDKTLTKKKSQKNVLRPTDLEKIGKLIAILDQLPLQHSSNHLLLSYMLLILCVVARLNTKHSSADAVGAAALIKSYQQKCIAMLDTVVLSLPSKELSILPTSTLIIYITKSMSKSPEAHISMIGKRLVTTLIKSTCYEKNKLQTLVQKLCRTMQESPNAEYLPPHLVPTLLCSSSVILKHKKVFHEVNKFLNPNPAHATTYKWWNPYLNSDAPQLKSRPTKAVFTTQNSIPLDNIASQLQNLMTVISEQDLIQKSANNIPDLLRGCLLSSFALDVHLLNEESSAEEYFKRCCLFIKESGLEKKVDEFVKSLATESDDKTAMSKMKLLALYTELRGAMFINEVKEVDQSTSWKSQLSNLIQIYSSPCVVNNEMNNILLDRVIYLHTSNIPDVSIYQEFLVEKVERIRQGNLDEVHPLLRFLQFITACFETKKSEIGNLHSTKGTDANSATSLTSESCQIKFLRDGFDACVDLVEHISTSNVELLPLVIVTFARITALGHKVINQRQLSILFSTLSRINLMKISKQDVRSDIVYGVQYVVSSMLMHHKAAISGLVPLILTTIQHLIQSALDFGRQHGSKDIPTEGKVEFALVCAEYVNRISHLITSNHASYFKRCVPYLIASYLHGLTKDTITQAVKNILQASMYNFLSLIDEHSVGMLKATLPVGVREVFRNLHSDYTKYFKYTGYV
ncbi:uncharacterized protein LOC100182751 [Ciona intestinalis]